MNSRIALRNRNNTPLSNERILELAPSAFAVEAHESRSDRYTFIPTVNVIDGLRNAGFQPVQASQSLTRVSGKENFTKHMIRFRAEGQVELHQATPEVVMINSHDGTSAYKVMLGVFRLVCSNGMIVSDGFVESVNVRHTGNIIQEVINATRALISNAPRVLEAVRNWQGIELLPAEQQFLAEGALALRYPAVGEDEPAQAPISADKLLVPNRYADQGNDLWRVFNRIQENAVNGGTRYNQMNPETRVIRRQRTREVKGIDQNSRLNRELWALAEKMAALKTTK